MNWAEVDEYLISVLVAEDEALRAARTDSRDAGLPPGEVAPNQGALLSLLARMIGARRVLEVGTYFGYSTMWLARAVGPTGTVTTLEVDPGHAELARRNLDRAGLADRVELVVGPAADSLGALTGPYDLVFIDADKPSNPLYLAESLRLTRPGSVIIADNVVRDGAVVDAGSADPRVQGVRRFLELARDEPRLDATALQTVGVKGWDGFALLLVTA